MQIAFCWISLESSQDFVRLMAVNFIMEMQNTKEKQIRFL